MRRFWWFVWVKVAILAAVLLVAYFTVSGIVKKAVSPYLVDEPVRIAAEGKQDEDKEEDKDKDENKDSQEEEKNILDKAMDWVDNKFDVHIDYESLIFDYANDYAQQMMEDSKQERTLTETP